MQQKAEKENTPEKILATAFECLSANGYANVSMRNIADEAGVALSQLAYYFQTKEKLFSEVINRMTAQYLREIEATLKSTADGKDKLGAFVKYFKDLIRDNPRLLKLFIDFTAQALWIPAFRTQLDSLFNALTEIIKENLSVKSLRGYPDKSIAKLVFGALFGTSIQILLGSEQDGALESLNLAENLLN